MSRRYRVVLLSLLAACLSACGGGGNGSDNADDHRAGATLESIVVLGDSVAAGEGINYGYTYSTDFPNGWTGGTDSPTWEGPYPLCHDSVQAYGDLVASTTHTALAKFACTGSSYENGIVFDRRANGQLYRPAQFGDWLSMTKLNADYDAAKPDVVIITLGADDVNFVDIVTFCATGYTLSDAAEVEAIGALSEPGDRIRANFVHKFPTPDALLHSPGRTESSYCTATNPGTPIENLFWDPINSGALTAHYIDLVKAIQARGEQAGKVPHIVFTTYHNPLPGPDESDDCLDLGDLERDEIDYLISLMDTLQNTLVAAVSGLTGVTVADISGSMNGHKFCSSDPWTYGLSVLLLDSASQAPFHPTAAGQASIAGIVAPVITSTP